jgi:hypothetical protein
MSMLKGILRPAFVATSVVTLASCTPRPLTNPPPPPRPAAEGESEEAIAAKKKKLGVHPSDAEGRLVFRKSNGTCYVQVQKSEPPPKDLMPGEKWVDDKVVTCPKEFDDPAFAAISDGYYWLRDEATGACSQAASYGNPPPPPVAAPCPPILEKNKKK